MSSAWRHTLCDACFRTIEPERQPFKLEAPEPEAHPLLPLRAADPWC